MPTKTSLPPRPPRLPDKPGAGDRRRTYWILAGVLLLTLAGSRLVSAWHVALPVCGLRHLTGLPCPWCGSTRCLAALVELDLAGAARLNPLTCLGGVGAFTWCLLGLASPDSPERWVGALRGRIGRGGWLVAVVLVTANWLYLLFNLPR